MTSSPPDAALRDPAAFDALMATHLPTVHAMGIRTLAIEPGLARMRLDAKPEVGRPGGSVAGPVLFAMCDVSMYAAIFGAVGHDAMALTATLTIHFLSRAPIEPLICETRVVKLGRRVVFLDSLIHAEAGGGPVVQATGSYLRSPG